MGVENQIVDKWKTGLKEDKTSLSGGQKTEENAGMYLNVENYVDFLWKGKKREKK